MLLRRREFVAAAAAAILVYGLDRFAAGGDDADATKKDAGPPQWWKDALAEMKATKSPGVAIVLPEGKDAREALRAGVEGVLRFPQLTTQIHLVEAVWVVADAKLAQAREGETAVLLDADGKRVDGAVVKFDAVDFPASVRPLLRGGERFAARVQAARTKEFEKALSDLADHEPVKYEAAVERMASNFAAFGPAVIGAWEGEKPGSDLQQRLSWVLSRVFARRVGEQGAEAERPLPFGTRWKAKDPPEPDVDPCPGCGMMRRPTHARDVLELLAKDPGTAK
jgi:hypothetical protein